MNVVTKKVSRSLGNVKNIGSVYEVTYDDDHPFLGGNE